MNLDYVQEIMNSPRRGGSSSRASSAAASTLKRPRQSDDAVSAHSPLAGGDKIPPRKKLAKTMSLPVSSCPKSNEGNGSQDKGKQVVTPPRLSKFTPLLYLSTVALDSSSSGSSSATKASRAVSTDSDIGEASPQEWVRSQAKKKRIKSAHGATVSPIGKGLQRRPFSLGVGVSLDTAIEIPSSDSSHSSIELLEDKSHWEVKEIMSHGAFKSPSKINRQSSSALLMMPLLNKKNSPIKKQSADSQIASGSSAPSSQSVNPDVTSHGSELTPVRKRTVMVQDAFLSLAHRSPSKSKSLASPSKGAYNVFGDRFSPKSTGIDWRTPKSTRNIVFSSEPGERLPLIFDNKETLMSTGQTPSPMKLARAKTPSDQGDVFDDFAGFAWTEPAAPAADIVPVMPMQNEAGPAEPPVDMIPTTKPPPDESLGDEKFHQSTFSNNNDSDSNVLPINTPLRSVDDKSVASTDFTLASLGCPEIETEGSSGERTGVNNQENTASPTKVSSAARNRALMLVAQAAEERNATLKIERQARIDAEKMAVDDDDEDYDLPSLIEMISNVETAKPVSSVGRLLRPRTNSCTSSSKGSVYSTPPTSAKPLPSEMDNQFSRMVQQQNRETKMGTGLALFKEVQSYDQRAPYPTPDLSNSPSPRKCSATGGGPGLQDVYGGWKGFWDESNPCLQTTIQPGRKSPEAELTADEIEKALFGRDEVAALAAMVMPQKAFSEQDVKLLESAPIRLYEGRRDGKPGDFDRQVTLWVKLLRQVFRISESLVIKPFLVPLILLSVDYDSSLALRVDLVSALMEGLARLSNDDYKPVMNDLFQETAQYGRGLQLGIAEALNRGPVIIKRFSQWFAALSLKAETADELLNEWSSKTDIPSPMTLTPHLRDQMLQMVCEDVAKASHGERTYKNSMVAFRLLAIALQDVEAILLALGEAEEVQDSLNVSMARQRWLTETKSLLREALETIPDERGNFTEITLVKRHIKGLESKLDFQGRTFMARLSTASRGVSLVKGTQTKLQIRRKVMA